MQDDSTQPISAREALGLNLCEEERDLLIQAAKNDWSVGDLYYELRLAAFDEHWDGETDEEEWKEDTWVDSAKDYEAFLAAATEYPLHFAVACGDAEWAGDLLKAGRTPQDADSEGTTPTDLLGRHGNDQSDQVIRAHNRAKLLDSMLPPASAWKPPEGGFGADAQRQVGAAMKAHGQDGQTLEAPRLRARF
ncbi:hypothetical protein [Stenotrophomonas sepilia]|uniref:hypothetical protein n=1 Tax=Stenotrophomonas sepilia TaxID=2860290 RepID=UPI002E75B88D|nr:hypothetical protein [Stenotrophomonas sepilia]